MVDLSGGQDGPIEHGFSNSVFILPGIIFVSLSGNMDLLQGVQDAVEEASAPVENSEGSLDQLLKSLGEAEGVSDEAKEKLIQILKAKGGAEGMLTQDTMSSLGSQSFSVEMMMLLGLLSIIFLVLVFFGYKLYTSLSERERKKEEKRRQKQQKKKK